MSGDCAGVHPLTTAGPDLYDPKTMRHLFHHRAATGDTRTQHTRQPWPGGLALLVVLLLAACGGSTSAATSNPLPTCAPPVNGAGPFVYVALGASDAVGYGATCPATQGYVPLLGARMPKSAHVVNLGVAGATLSLALVDELPDAVAAAPNLITVWLAANDFRAMQNGKLTLAQYTAQFDQLLAALHAHTHAPVYVANLPHLVDLPYFQHGTVPLATTDQENTQWNAVISAEAAKYGDVLVDLYHSDLAAHPDYIFADGFHPSTLGYQQLAAYFWAAIQAHGGVKA